MENCCMDFNDNCSYCWNVHYKISELLMGNDDSGDVFSVGGIADD